LFYQVLNEHKVSKALICPKTGKTATNNCADAYTEYFLQGTIPDQCTICAPWSKDNSGSGKNQTKRNDDEDEDDIGP